MLRYNPYIGKNRHEIGIAAPARHNVHVKMIGYPGTGLPTEIHPDIEPVGGKLILQYVAAEDEITVHLQCLGLRDVIEVGDMPIGSDQEVTVGIRIPVHDDEGMFSALQDKSLPICTRNIPDAEDAATVRWILFAADISHPPGGPKLFHSFLSRSAPLSSLGSEG
jgi:hypothetical protein